ncbi:PREDICTED: ryanodine receptor 2-like [Poecilia mexicana]|uniref:ryanodine receptor 2-like n=1 Tax=Poecilia mexicana TaxID=48701 RepID=UPI00072EB66F|nr:PREDICTED: ryanodine receptor 2-like [Poecilia mexicana]
MVWAGESSSPGQGRNNNGLEIGCLVDTTNCLLSFTANGKELSMYYQVEPSTKLFPAVFAKATSPNVFQFELGRIKVCGNPHRHNLQDESFFTFRSVLIVLLLHNIPIS